MIQRTANALILIGAIGATVCLVSMPACATAQQFLIKADMAYATAVFALDDSEYAACHPSAALSPAVCADLDGKVAQALQDVQATTRATQLFPTRVPKDLPALLDDLNNVQTILITLPSTPLTRDLTAKAQAANGKAIELLNRLLGIK